MYYIPWVGIAFDRQNHIANTHAHRSQMVKWIIKNTHTYTSCTFNKRWFCILKSIRVLCNKHTAQAECVHRRSILFLSFFLSFYPFWFASFKSSHQPKADRRKWIDSKIRMCKCQTNDSAVANGEEDHIFVEQFLLNFYCEKSSKWREPIPNKNVQRWKLELCTNLSRQCDADRKR